jgi:hypothetical protein
MAVHALRFNVKHRPSETASPVDLDGIHLGELFEGWCRSMIGSDALVDHEMGHFVQVSDVANLPPGFVLVTTQVGSWGDIGCVMDMDTLTERAHLRATDATTAFCRTALHVPNRGETAYLFTEYADRGNGGGRLYEVFRSEFANRYAFTMKRAPEYEARTWAEAAEVQSVTVRVLNYSGDVADPHSEVVGTVTHTFKPKRPGFFGVDLVERLRRDKGEALRLVQLDEMPDRCDRAAEVLIEVASAVTGMKQRKTFVVGDDWGTPAIREVLSDHGRSMIPDDAFVYRCQERLAELGVAV